MMILAERRATPAVAWLQHDYDPAGWHRGWGEEILIELISITMNLSDF
jgi:hypothetical protein